MVSTRTLVALFSLDCSRIIGAGLGYSKVCNRCYYMCNLDYELSWKSILGHSGDFGLVNSRSAV